MNSEQEIFNFATIGEVFDDGVSLVFDGQDAASEKHYKVNTSIVFKEGDRVKILSDSGTYVVEYVVGAPKKQEKPVVGLPSGGSAGQSLIKSTNDDYAAGWGDPRGIMPSGGAAGQVLLKKSATYYDAEWGAPKGIVPAGGSMGQVLKKSTSSDYSLEWADSDGIPSGGSAGQALIKTSASAVGWGAPAGTLPTGGSTGQFLKKSSYSDYAATWSDVTAANGLPTGGTAGQCLIKDSTTAYDASWGNPTKANGVADQRNSTSDSYLIQFQTDISGNFYIRSGKSGTWKKLTIG